LRLRAHAADNLRITVLGTTAWTPAPVILGLGLAVPFGLAAPVLMIYGITGLRWQAQDWP